MSATLILGAFLVGAFCFGACLGSFANVCIWRMPRPGLSPASPARSLCPRCGFRLPWFDNIPMVSWFLLKGSCRRCGGTIALRYTVVELATALMALLLAWRFLGSECLPGQFVLWTIAAWAFVVAAWIDLELMLLPDEIVLPGLGLAPWLFLAIPEELGPGADGVGRALAGWLGDTLGGGLALGPQGGSAAAAVLGALGGVGLGEYVRRTASPDVGAATFWNTAPFYALGAAYGALIGRSLADPASLAAPGMGAFASSLLGAASGAGIVGAVRWLGRHAFAQEAMGFGDVKLMALLGALTGVGGTLWIVVLASVAGAVVGGIRYVFTRERQLPFGPFLIGGAAAVLAGRQQLGALLAWYGTLVGGR